MRLALKKKMYEMNLKVIEIKSNFIDKINKKVSLNNSILKSVFKANKHSIY